MVTLDDFRNDPERASRELQSESPDRISDLMLNLYNMHDEYEPNHPPEFRCAVLALLTLRKRMPNIIYEVYYILYTKSRRASVNGHSPETYSRAAKYLWINLNLGSSGQGLEQKVS